MNKPARVRLGMQALCVTMHGVAATKAELHALESAAQAAMYDAQSDSDVALMRAAALDLCRAAQITEELIGALRTALSAFIAPQRDAQSVKPAYDWQKRKDMA